MNTADQWLLGSRFNAKFKKRSVRVIKFHHPGFDPNRLTLLYEVLVNEELLDASRRYDGKFSMANRQGLQNELQNGSAPVSKGDMDTDDVEELGNRRLCSGCVGEAYLSAEIEKEGEAGTCDYCGKTAKTVSIEEMAERIELAFESHYERTSTEPSAFQYAMLKDRESDYEWEREGAPVEEVIAEAAEIDNAPAEDIRSVLDDRTSDYENAQMGEEDPFDEDAHYASKDIDDIEYQENWRYFEKNLKTEARFFSVTAEATLESVFEGLIDHRTHDGKPVIVEAGPGTEIPVLFRARVFQSLSKLAEALGRPDAAIGSPSTFAASAGRMNARGISVFYGATAADVAIGEVRPPVGSRVVVGRFALLRKIRLIDVNALREVYVDGSIFDPSYVSQLQRAKFLQRLSERVTAPVMPDHEPLEYLVTQTIADYLATRPDLSLDGVLYPSAQGPEGGVNVMMFHKSARVATIDVPAGTEIRPHTGRHTEDGWEEEYWVYEEVPPSETKDGLGTKDAELHFASILDDTISYDAREPTLAIDLKGVIVHLVKAATFETQAFTVHRHRSEKAKTPF